jgi:hypothetical protein
MKNQYLLLSVLRYWVATGLAAEYVAIFLSMLQVILAVLLMGNLHPRKSTLAVGAMFLCLQWFKRQFISRVPN